MKTVVLCSLALGILCGTASGQCRLAVNDPPEPVDISTLVDTTLFSGIDPFQETMLPHPQCDIQLLRTYAYSLFATGDHELQARIYTYILRHERNFLDMYNLACCYSRLGMAGKTLEFLGHAFEYGYMDVDWVEQDTDMDLVRDTPRYRELIEQQRGRIAALEEERGPVIGIEYPVTLPCRIVLPGEFDPGVEHTLVIGLHGAGDSAERFSALVDYFGENDFVYAAPQAPITVPGGNGYLWFDGPIDPDVVSDRVRYVAEVISEISDAYAVGEVYLVGFSQGGALAYMTGIARPDLVDGVVVFGGAIEPGWFGPDDLAGAAGLRVFIAHGTDDDIDLGRNAFQVLSEAGLDTDFHEFPGGHYIHLDTLHEAVAWIGE